VTIDATSAHPGTNCSECGTPYASPTAKFCRACGAQRDVPIAAAPVPPPIPPPPIFPDSPRPETPTHREPRRRRRVGLGYRLSGVMVIVLGIAALGGWGGWTLRDHRAEPVPAPVEVNVDVSRPVLVLDEAVQRAGTMPNIVGLSRDQARQVMIDAGFGIDGVTEVGAPYAGAADQVIGQEPRAGAPIGDAVTLTVSQATAVPAMIGSAVNDARDVLVPLGVRVTVEPKYVAGQPEGIVLGSTPPAGEALGTELTLTVAQAASSVFLGELRPVSNACSQSEITINATVHPNALVCSPSNDDIESSEYVLNRRVELFEASIGIDDRSATTVPVAFRVYVDDVLAFEASMSYGSAQEIAVPVSGALRVRLDVVRAGELDSCCDTQAGWGSARLSGGQSAVDALISESNP
jgi:NPCBM/NEW2 domain/PASTA domain